MKCRWKHLRIRKDIQEVHGTWYMLHIRSILVATLAGEVFRDLLPAEGVVEESQR